VINQELALYDAELATRPQLVALNKMDLLPEETKVEQVESALRSEGCRVFRISALSGEGVRRLVGEAAVLLRGLPVPMPQEAPAAAIAPTRQRLVVAQLGSGVFQVSGEAVERLVVMTDLDNDEAVRYLHRRLERMGVIRKLRQLGAKDGDKVKIGSVKLDFVE
jgi:GTP-binding protein